MSDRNILFLLEDIKESIENILSFTNGLSFDIYCSDIKTVHAVQHNFMIIGEAVAKIQSMTNNIIKPDPATVTFF